MSPPMVVHTWPQWAAHLRAVAAQAAGAEPPRIGTIGAAFADAVSGTTGPTGPEGLPGREPEVALWRAVAGAQVDVAARLGASIEGPLWPEMRGRGLEVWTDAELSGLHALWHLARREGRADWRRRVDRVRDWHLDNTQPDNATNRPWALHVFLLAGTAEGRLYAETLLHNALITGPEPFGAWILLDAAQALETYSSEPK